MDLIVVYVLLGSQLHSCFGTLAMVVCIPHILRFTLAPWINVSLHYEDWWLTATKVSLVKVKLTLTWCLAIRYCPAWPGDRRCNKRSSNYNLWNWQCRQWTELLFRLPCNSKMHACLWRLIHGLGLVNCSCVKPYKVKNRQWNPHHFPVGRHLRHGTPQPNPSTTPLPTPYSGV